MSQAIRSLFNRIESFGLKREKNNSNLIPSFYWSTQKNTFEKGSKENSLWEHWEERMGKKWIRRSNETNTLNRNMNKKSV